LKKHQDDLTKSLDLFGPVLPGVRQRAGNGRWFDVYVQNLIPGVVTVK